MKMETPENLTDDTAWEMLNIADKLFEEMGDRLETIEELLTIASSRLTEYKSDAGEFIKRVRALSSVRSRIRARSEDDYF